MTAILLLLFLLGAPAPQTEYRLGPGDILEITVFEVEELSRPAVVSPEGSALLPLIGLVPLGGLTPLEAAARLRDLYGGDLIRNPQVTVSVKEHHSQPVAVLGAVSKPGVYQLRGPRRLSDVVAMAGGLVPDAGSEITVSRPAPGGGETSIAAAVRDLLNRGASPEGNPWIQANDTVRVSKAGIVYVIGEVGRAGGFPLKDQEGLTVLKALSLAGGLGPAAAPQKSKIIRKQPGGQQETPVQETPVRLRDILDGRAPDLPLEPEDVLFIPNSRARTALGRATEAAIQVTTGVIIWRR